MSTSGGDATQYFARGFEEAAVRALVNGCHFLSCFLAADLHVFVACLLVGYFVMVWNQATLFISIYGEVVEKTMGLALVGLIETVEHEVRFDSIDALLAPLARSIMSQQIGLEAVKTAGAEKRVLRSNVKKWGICPSKSLSPLYNSTKPAQN